MVRENDIGKTSHREVSSLKSETGRKGSKSGAPAEIGRYHMYVSFTSCSILKPILYHPMPVWSHNVRSVSAVL